MENKQATPPQDQWALIVENSGYTINYLCTSHDISNQAFSQYLRLLKKPYKKNLAKMEAALSEAQKQSRIIWSPSYGFATQEQIDELKSIGLGPRRDQILKDIEAQTKRRGKVK